MVKSVGDVVNCAGEIPLPTNPNQRRHLPTKQNPADFLTQGFSITSLREEEKWWNGPLINVLSKEPRLKPNKNQTEKLRNNIEKGKICKTKH